MQANLNYLVKGMNFCEKLFSTIACPKLANYPHKVEVSLSQFSIHCMNVI